MAGTVMVAWSRLQRVERICLPSFMVSGSAAEDGPGSDGRDETDASRRWTIACEPGRKGVVSAHGMTCMSSHSVVSAHGKTFMCSYSALSAHGSMQPLVPTLAYSAKASYIVLALEVDDAAEKQTSYTCDRHRSLGKVVMNETVVHGSRHYCLFLRTNQPSPNMASKTTMMYGPPAREAQCQDISKKPNVASLVVHNRSANSKAPHSYSECRVRKRNPRVVPV